MSKKKIKKSGKVTVAEGVSEKSPSGKRTVPNETSDVLAKFPPWLKQGPGPHVAALLIFFFITLFLARNILGEGFLLFMDGTPHCGRTQMVMESFSQGIIYPIWSNKWFCGYPLLQFYSPLYFWITAAMALVLGDVWLASKIFLFVSFILACFGMYLFCREFTGSWTAGILAGVLFGLNPNFFTLLAEYMRSPHALALIVMPWLWYLFERFMKGKDSLVRSSCCTGLAIAVFIIGHQGYAFFCTIIFSLYVLLHTLRIRPLRIEWQPVLFLTLTGIVAFALAMFYLVPVYFESGSTVMFSDTFARKTPGFQAPAVHTLLSTLSRDTFLQSMRVRYLGLAPLILGVSGAVLFGIRDHGRRALIFAFMLGLSYFVFFGHKNPVYQHLPFVFSQLEIIRLSPYWIFFLSFLAGAGFHEACGLVESKLGGWQWRQAAGVVLLALIIGDYLVVRQFKWPSWENKRDITDAGLLSQLAEIVKQKYSEHPSENDSRFYAAGSHWYVASRVNNIITSLTGIPSPIGTFKQVQSMDFMMFMKSVQEWVAQDVNQNGHPGQSLDALKLLNVSTLLFVDRKVNAFNIPAFPAIASTRLTPLETKDEANAHTIVAAMKLHPSLPVAETLVIDHLSSLEPLDEGSPEPLQLENRSFHQTINHTELTVRLNRPAYLRLSHHFYRCLNVRVQGVETPFIGTPEDFIVIKCPAGESKITIDPILTPLRKATLLISICSLAAMIWFGFIPNPLLPKLDWINRKYESRPGPTAPKAKA